MRRRIILVIAGMAMLACWIALAPLAADTLVVEKRIDKADAILILSGAADYRQRARGGAEAYKANAASRILISDDNERGGWDDREKGNPFFVDRMERELVELGVPRDAIERLPGTVSGTNEEAALALRTAARKGYGSLLIVTSPFHSRRALWTFERMVGELAPGVTVGLICSPSGETYPDRYTWWLTPRGWRSVGAEYVKFGWYWMFY